MSIYHDDFFTLNPAHDEIMSHDIGSLEDIAIGIFNALMSCDCWGQVVEVVVELSVGKILDHAGAVRRFSGISRKDIGYGTLPATPIKVGNWVGQDSLLRWSKKWDCTDRS